MVTSLGSSGGQDPFLGAAGEEVLHPPVEKCDILGIGRTEILNLQADTEDAEFY